MKVNEHCRSHTTQRYTQSDENQGTLTVTGNTQTHPQALNGQPQLKE